MAGLLESMLLCARCTRALRPLRGGEKHSVRLCEPCMRAAEAAVQGVLGGKTAQEMAPLLAGVMVPVGFLWALAQRFADRLEFVRLSADELFAAIWSRTVPAGSDRREFDRWVSDVVRRYNDRCAREAAIRQEADRAAAGVPPPGPAEVAEVAEALEASNPRDPDLGVIAAQELSAAIRRMRLNVEAPSGELISDFASEIKSLPAHRRAKAAADYIRRLLEAMTPEEQEVRGYKRRPSQKAEARKAIAADATPAPVPAPSDQPEAQAAPAEKAEVPSTPVEEVKQ